MKQQQKNGEQKELNKYKNSNRSGSSGRSSNNIRIKTIGLREPSEMLSHNAHNIFIRSTLLFGLLFSSACFIFCAVVFAHVAAALRRLAIECNRIQAIIVALMNRRQKKNKMWINSICMQNCGVLISHFITGSTAIHQWNGWIQSSIVIISMSIPPKKRRHRFDFIEISNHFSVVSDWLTLTSLEIDVFCFVVFIRRWRWSSVRYRSGSFGLWLNV